MPTNGSLLKAAIAAVTSKPIRSIALLLLGGCTTQTWVAADLQLDISGSGFVDTDLVRICVEDIGMREVALGAGRVAFTGIAPETDISVTVDTLADSIQDSGADALSIRSGRAGPMTLGPGNEWSEAPWVMCDTDEVCMACQTPGERVPTGSDSVVLSVRFLR